MGAHASWKKCGLLVAALCVVVALLAGAVMVLNLIVRPRVEPVRPVDVLYVIGPADGRMDQARRLMAEGTAETLVVTLTMDTRTGVVAPNDFCAPQAYEVICVLPDPYTTRGEAGVLTRLSAEHGWERAGVMTETAHVARTRLWMARCAPLEVLVWESGEQRIGAEWVEAIAYQSGAWVKAQLQSSCV